MFSYNGLYIGHYKAASFDHDLSLLHAAKISAMLEQGVLLERWGGGLGVTILFDKTIGVTYVNKLQAMCMFKADFN